MIGDPVYLHPTDYDRSVYRAVVPPSHRLRTLLEVIPWEEFNDILAAYYSPDQGRPSEPPVMMLKFEVLRWFFNLSDPGVIERATTDLAFRHFLQIRISGPLPHPTSLCRFRARLGVEGFREIFSRVVRIAREHGVVKDRLRLKDATHVLANIHVPSALELVGRVRDKLLVATEPFAHEMVAGERVNLEMLRESTRNLNPTERLLTRVAHLRDLLTWIDEVPAPDDAEENRAWQTFCACRDLAHKILREQEDPRAGDRTRSTTDPDARRAKHGEWFDGYLMDILVDADSEIITQINVLPGNGDEAADTVWLVQQEETTHDNDIAAVSIDGAGFNGAMLHTLHDPSGPELEVFVPPPPEKKSARFPSADFIEDRDAGVVTCPAGQTSSSCKRDRRDHGMTYAFKKSTCAACPLQSQCVPELGKKSVGRWVSKNDYESDYSRARQKATTPEYQAVRREHMKVERKLGEVMNCHGGRRPRCRGQPKVLCAEYMAATVTNFKRLVRLLSAPSAEMSLASTH